MEGFQGGALPTNCTVDGDCPTSLVCYDASLSWTRNQSWCLCSTWYGWELDQPANSSTNCGLGGSTIAVITIFAICTAFLIWRTVILLITLERQRKSQRLKNNPSFALGFVYCLGWLISAILRLIFDCLEFGLPQEQTIMPFGPSWKYSPFGLYQSKPLFAATTVFGILVDYQLIVVWFSVAVTGAKKRQPSSSITVLKGSVLMMELSYIIGASILVGGDQISPFLYFSVAFYALALMGYLISGKMLFKLLSDALNKQRNSLGVNPDQLMVNIARNIKHTAISNGILIVLNLVCMIALAETNKTFKEYGNFVPAGFHTAQIVVMTAQLFVTTHYLYVSTPASKNTDQIPSKPGVPVMAKGHLKADGDPESKVRNTYNTVRTLEGNAVATPKNVHKEDTDTIDVVVDHYEAPASSSTSSNQPLSNSNDVKGAVSVKTSGKVSGSPHRNRKPTTSEPSSTFKSIQDDDLLLEYHPPAKDEMA